MSYTYDQLNRMDTVTDVGTGIQLVDYTWDTLSRRDLSAFNASGFSADYGYENDDDLNALAHSGPAPLTFTLGRNLASQITSLAVSDGAFLARPAANHTDSYTPNKLNQIASLNATSYTYDTNGNLASDGTYSFEYDEENRLRSAVGAGNTISYEYDPLGRRRAKIVNGVTTKYASDGAEEIEERDGSNNVLRRYAYGPSIDDRIAMFDTSYCPHSISSQSWCFYLTNWQGSTTTMVKRDGSLREVYHYGPYGEGVNWTPQDALTGNPFRYTGRRVDPETGLYYYRARYYSTKLGRFLQVDPIGTKDDFNLYAYVGNDPANHVDPSGLACVPLLNNSSPYCDRATLYGQLDGKLSAQTRFFAAASATTQSLASLDMPVAGAVAVSGQTRRFMSTLSGQLQAMNVGIARSIESGELRGPGLDARIVRTEQTAVQSALDKLGASNRAAYDTLIGEVNSLLNPSTDAQRNAATFFGTDAAYSRILNGVRADLGRDIDFAKQSDREAIGDAVIEHIRKTGGCDVTGSRIKTC